MSVDNILATYDGATKADIETGTYWYLDAHGIAKDIAHEHRTTPAVVAGVIAALSPRLEWGANLNLAHRFIASGGLQSGYLKVGLAKAQRILDGDPETIETILGGPKVRAFYDNIATAGRSDRVTVDRHAIDIARGRHQTDMTRGSLTVKQYEALADEYRTAARIIGGGLFPAQLQAITWTAWRRQWGGKHV